jgi:carbonic anhydrase
MDRLREGVAKFQREVFPQHRHLYEELAGQQKPETLFITCADSRIVPQMITQSRPGDLFICRNAGNMVPPYGEVSGGVSATIEYSVCVLEVKHIIVMGHTDCGAMRALMHPEKVEKMPTVKSWLSHGEVARTIVAENCTGCNDEEKLPMLTEENIVAQLNHLRTHPSVAARLARRAIQLHGWLYDIRSADVQAYDPRESRFVPLAQYHPVDEPVRERLALAG